MATAPTTDQQIIRYATQDGHQPIALPQLSNCNIYAGTLAITGGGNGYLKDPWGNGVTTSDTVWGMINGQLNGYPHVTAPMAGGATNGLNTLGVDTGTFWLTPGTAADALTEANVGATVYAIDGLTVGATTNGNTRPAAGTLVQIGTGFYSGLVAVRLNPQGNP